MVRYTAADVTLTPNAISVDGRGRALVAFTLRSCNRSCSVRAAVMRFRRDGQLDRTFGRTGVFRSADRGAAETIRSLPGGKTLVAGARGGRFLVWKLDRRGRLDRTFGLRGLATSPRRSDPLNQGRPERATEMTIDPRNRIVIMGISPESGDALHFARFRPGGSPDPAFGDRGTARFHHAGTSRGPVGLVATDGRIITSDWRVGCSPLWALRSATGEPDEHFNSLGRAFACGRSQTVAPAALDLDADGFIITFNNEERPPSTFKGPRHTVERFHTDGTPDMGFGTSGIVPVSVSSGVLRDGLVDPQGRLVTMGERDTAPEGFAVRMSPGGFPEMSFAGAGEASWHGARTSGDRAEAIYPHDGGYTVVGGYNPTGSSFYGEVLQPVGAVRLDRRGHLLPGPNPAITLLRGYHTRPRISAALQGDRLIVAGYASKDIADPYVIRLGTDGQIDPRFGTDGHASLPEHIPPAHTQTLPDGGILLGSPTNEGALVGKLDRTGELDRSFGDRGTRQVTLSSGQNPHVDLRSILSDDRARTLLTAESSRCTADRCRHEIVLLRLLGNGRTDKSFGRRGRLVIPGKLEAVGISRDGAIAVSTDACRKPLERRKSCPGVKHVARLDSAGTRLPAFGTSAKLQARGMRVAAVSPLPSGGVVLAGRQYGHGVVMALDKRGRVTPFGRRRSLTVRRGFASGLRALLPIGRHRVVAAGWTRTRTGGDDFLTTVLRLP